MNYIQTLFFSLLLFGSISLGNVESCIEEPALAIDAGSELSMKIRNAFGARCSAELVFVDEIPSMTWYFEPAECVGSQLAQFSVPFDVPNGDAYITWQCEEEGTMSCNRISISKGNPAVTATPRLITETARCLSLTTFITHVTSDKGDPTGVPPPIITESVSASLETLNTDVATTPTPATSKRPAGYKTLIGTGETRKTGKTSARLGTDTPAPTTPTSVSLARTTPLPTTTTTIPSLITNTGTVTVPVVIPIPDSTSVTTVRTGEFTTNERIYITVTSIISTCPTLMKL